MDCHLDVNFDIDEVVKNCEGRDGLMKDRSSSGLAASTYFVSEGLSWVGTCSVSSATWSRSGFTTSNGERTHWLPGVGVCLVLCFDEFNPLHRNDAGVCFGQDGVDDIILVYSVAWR